MNSSTCHPVACCCWTPLLSLSRELWFGELTVWPDYLSPHCKPREGKEPHMSQLAQSVLSPSLRGC